MSLTLNTILQIKDKLNSSFTYSERTPIWLLAQAKDTFQIFKAKQPRDVASACERIHVVWTLSDSGLMYLKSSPQGPWLSQMLTVEVFVGDAGEERIVRRA